MPWLKNKTGYKDTSGLETSRNAAIHALEGWDDRAKDICALLTDSPRSVEQVVDIMRLPRNGVAPVFSKLRKDGVIIATEDRHINSNGRSEAVWAFVSDPAQRKPIRHNRSQDYENGYQAGYLDGVNVERNRNAN